MKSFHCLTFGCQMNANDSQWVARALEQQGMVSAPMSKADIVFLNTCSVRNKPEQKVYSTLGHIRKKNPQALVAVAGCVAQQIGEKLFARSAQVRLIVGSDGIAAVPAALIRLMHEPNTRLSYLNFTPTFPERDPYLVQELSEHESPAPIPDSPIAYVNIMQGCDNFCAYCIVPYTRGPRKSRIPEAIVEECQGWLSRGAGDITLLGQNVNAYGLDKPELGITFAQLLHRVAALPGLRRLRFVSAHPRDMSPDTVAAFKELPVLCPRLHLPLQSGSNSVLARMGRGYTTEDFLRLVDQLRKTRPDLALSTDLIVGFPGETEEEFCQTLQTVKDANFMASFSFCYSDRPGTRAAIMPDKIPPALQKERLGRLQALQADLGGQYLKNLIGKETEVLLEAPSRMDVLHSWQGHDLWGNTVNVQVEGKVGMLVPVRLVGAGKHSLMGEIVQIS